MIFHTFPKAAQIPKTDLRGPEQDLKRLNPTLLSGYQPAALPRPWYTGYEPAVLGSQTRANFAIQTRNARHHERVDAE